MNSKIPNFREQSSVGLIGACVARSFKEVAFPNVASSHYLWRVNTVSLMSKASSQIDVSERISEKTDFLSVDRDLNKNFDLEKFFNKQNIIVLDYARDYYPVTRLLDNRMVTVSHQYNKYNLWNLIGENTIISPYGAEYIDIWLQAMQEFAYIANTHATVLLIVPSIMSQGFVEGNSFRSPENFDAFDIMYKNKILYFMENIAYFTLDKSFILPSMTPFSRLDLNHIYGIGPVHLDNNIDKMRTDYIENMGDLLVRADSLTSETRHSAIAMLTQQWKAAALIGYS